MKGKIFLITVIALLCSTTAADARYRSRSYFNNAHYYVVGGGLGYSSLFENNPELATLGNVGGALSFGYELRLNNFWMNINAEIQFLSASSTFKISGADKMIYDTQGKEAMMHYDFEHSLDKQNFTFANLPVMVGYKYEGFYIGVGAKIGYCLFAQEATHLTYHTSASYEEYIDDFDNMQPHYYSTYKSAAREDLVRTFKAALTAEVGYDVLSGGRKDKHSGLKVGAYIEYGLNNIINTTEEQPLYSISNNNASKVQVHPFYSANASQPFNVRPFYAGVKLSWFFCIHTKNCDCDIRTHNNPFFVSHKSHHRRHR